MALNDYVKFLKGTPSAYEALTSKDPNTLYFIYEDAASEGVMYLGNKKIGIGDASELELLVDDLSISQADNGTLYLANYGKSYYKFIAATDDSESTYEKVEVSIENPWKEGLEPRVTTENGKLVLGWFEPNPTTIEGLQNNITAINSTLVSQKTEIESLKTAVNETIPNTIDSKITAAIAEKDLLSYTIAEVDGEGNIVLKETNPEQYIYLVANEEGNYDEYMYIDNKFEKVGDWKVDLSGYVTTDQFNTVMSNQAGTNANLAGQIETLQGSFNTLNSTVGSQGQTISQLDASLQRLAATVNEHSTTIAEHTSAISSINSTISSQNTRIQDLETALTWKSLSQ